MSKKPKFGIPCSEANHVCDKAQYKESYFLEKVKLNITFIFAEPAENSAKNSKLTLIKNSKVKTCPEKKKEVEKDIKKEFQKKVPK